MNKCNNKNFLDNNKLNKLENVIHELKIKKLIYKKNFAYFLNNINTKNKSKINTIKLYTFSLSREFKKLIRNLKKKIYGTYLKKISFTYLYSIAIRYAIKNLKKNISKKFIQKKIIFFQIKNFLRKTLENLRKFYLNSVIEISKIDKFLVNSLKTNEFFHNKYFLRENLIEEISETKNKLNPYNIHECKFSELKQDFLIYKNFILKKIILEGLKQNKIKNKFYFDKLSKFSNFYLHKILFDLLRNTYNKKLNIGEKTCEFILLKKHLIISSAIKNLKNLKKNQEKRKSTKNKIFKLLNKIKAKAFFFTCKQISDIKFKIKSKLKISNYNFIKKILFSKIKSNHFKNCSINKKFDLLKRKKMKKIVNIISSNYYITKEYKNIVINILLLIDKC